MDFYDFSQNPIGICTQKSMQNHLSTQIFSKPYRYLLIRISRFCSFWASLYRYLATKIGFGFVQDTPRDGTRTLGEVGVPDKVFNTQTGGSWSCPFPEDKIYHFSELFSFLAISGRFEQNWTNRSNCIYTRKSNEIDIFLNFLHFWRFLTIPSRTAKLESEYQILSKTMKINVFWILKKNRL